MKRLALCLASLLAAAGCATPTAPDARPTTTAARAASAKTQLEGASQGASLSRNDRLSSN